MFQVVDIMRVNVDKVLERDQKISELDDRAGIVHLMFDNSLCSYHSTGWVVEWYKRWPRSREVAGLGPSCAKPKVLKLVMVVFLAKRSA